LRFIAQQCSVAAVLAFATRASSDELAWEFQPYRVHALLAVDVPGGTAAPLAGDLPKHLRRRLEAAMGRLWSFDIHLATGAMHRRVRAAIADVGSDPPADLPDKGNKLLLLAVRWTPDGYRLAGREFDRYVERWGMPITITCRQAQAVPECLVALAWQAVAPLARIELDADDAERVRLLPLGAGLVPAGADATTLEPGDVLLPVLRRTTRSGKLLEGGLQVIPWTYLEVAEVSKDGVLARVYSANRRPFGARRHGYVEQLAIAVRAEPAASILRLHGRTAPEKPLVGYQVFAEEPGAGEPDAGRTANLTPLGATDRNGAISIPPGDARIRMLHIKSGGQLLARLPFVPGAQPEIDVPLPDDAPRLAAEARLAALREELVDVVARRNILMARIRQKIKRRDFDSAEKLLAEADQLPGRSQFNLVLTTAARTQRSEDPQIQRRIDQLIAATQTVMTQFLDLRPLNKLHEELRAARNSPAEQRRTSATPNVPDSSRQLQKAG
jgi:hypothetical protein